MVNRMGFKMVGAMRAFSEWLERKAIVLNVMLSMRAYFKEHGHY